MAHADPFGEDVAAGRRALLACEWAEAREAFERAAAAGAGTVALEGLVRAAFMFNDPAVALDARERAYAGYREAGKAVAAARVAVALAWDYRAYRGEPAVSDGWLARARRLLSGGPPTAELGWLELREASFALPEDPAAALASSARAEELGRALGTSISR